LTHKTTLALNSPRRFSDQVESGLRSLPGFTNFGAAAFSVKVVF
jgi:hypothetical protein